MPYPRHRSQSTAVRQICPCLLDFGTIRPTRFGAVFAQVYPSPPHSLDSGNDWWQRSPPPRQAPSCLGRSLRAVIVDDEQNSRFLLTDPADHLANRWLPAAIPRCRYPVGLSDGKRGRTGCIVVSPRFCYNLYILRTPEGDKNVLVLSLLIPPRRTIPTRAI